MIIFSDALISDVITIVITIEICERMYLNGKINHTTQRTTIETTSKESDYSKQCVKYCQSWHLGMTNKLIQKALRKRTHSSRQSEVAVLTYRHSVVENGLGLNLPAIVTKSFKKCSISYDLDGPEDDVLWAEQYDKSDTDSDEKGDVMYDGIMTYEQIQQVFSEENDDDLFCVGGFSILLILVRFIASSIPGGLLVLKAGTIIREYIRYFEYLL